MFLFLKNLSFRVVSIFFAALTLIIYVAGIAIWFSRKFISFDECDLNYKYAIDKVCVSHGPKLALAALGVIAPGVLIYLLLLRIIRRTYIYRELNKRRIVKTNIVINPQVNSAHHVNAYPNNNQAMYQQAYPNNGLPTNTQPIYPQAVIYPPPNPQGGYFQEVNQGYRENHTYNQNKIEGSGYTGGGLNDTKY